MEKITKEKLIEDGWVLENFEPLNTEVYSKEKKNLHLILKYLPEITNRVDADWVLHIDNCDFDTIAKVDVKTMAEIDAIVAAVSCGFEVDEDIIEDAATKVWWSDDYEDCIQWKAFIKGAKWLYKKILGHDV